MGHSAAFPKRSGAAVSGVGICPVPRDGSLPRGLVMLLLLACCSLLTGCAGAQNQRGGYYLDDGPGGVDRVRLARLLEQPDPVPVDEKLLDRANRPYQVMGQRFTPMTERKPYRQAGVASWYGKRFHGRPTSTGEIYDMYAMTAAHPTLPLPSYARVRNLENGREVVVRVNDRGPFLRGRLIDLSYLAAHKLGYVRQGHARVLVELIDPALTARAGAKATARDVAASDGGGRGAAAGQGGPLLAAATMAGMPVPADDGPRAQAPVADERGRPAQGGAGWYLQLGVFAELDNALRSQRRQQAESGAADPFVEVIEQAGHYQVLVGPFADEAAARAAAQRIERRGRSRPWVMFRR